MKQNKTILITHSTDVFGHGFILNALKQDMRVIFNDQPDKAHLANKILAAANALGLLHNLQFIPADLSTEEGVEKLIDTALEKCDNLNNFIINCPINYEKTLPVFHELTHLEWKTTLNTYLQPNFFLTRRIIEELLIQGSGGKIIQIALPQAQMAKHAVYNSIQTALYSYIRSIAKEYGRRNILCNVIVPATIENQESNIHSLIELLLYLLSDSASFITGEIFKLESSINI